MKGKIFNAQEVQSILICQCCKEETTEDTTSKKWNISKKSEHPMCFECDWRIFEQENYHLYRDYGPEEIAEDNERIRRNNSNQYEQERNENNYYEVETLPTLGLSLSSGGKRKIYY